MKVDPFRRGKTLSHAAFKRPRISRNKTTPNTAGSKMPTRKSPVKKTVRNKSAVPEKTRKEVENLLHAIETSNQVLSMHHDQSVTTLREKQLRELQTMLFQKKTNLNVWNNVKDNVLLGNLLSEAQQKVDPRTVLNEQCIWIGTANATLSPSNIVSFCIPNDTCTHTVCFSMDDLITHIHKYTVEQSVPNLWAEELKSKLPAALHEHISPVMNNDWVDYIKTHHKILKMNEITKQLKTRDMHIFNWLLKKLVDYAQLVPGVLFLGTFITRIGEKVPSFMQGWLKYSKLTLMSIFNNPSWVFALTVLSKGIRMLLCMRVVNLSQDRRKVMHTMILGLVRDKPFLKEITTVLFVLYDCLNLNADNCDAAILSAVTTSALSIKTYTLDFIKFSFNSLKPDSSLLNMMIDGINWTVKLATVLTGNKKVEDDLAIAFAQKHLAGPLNKMYYQCLFWIFVYHYPSYTLHNIISVLITFVPALKPILEKLHLHYRFEELKQLKKTKNKDQLTMGHIFTLIIKIRAVFESMRLIYEELKEWIKLIQCWIINKTQKGGGEPDRVTETLKDVNQELNDRRAQLIAKKAAQRAAKMQANAQTKLADVIVNDADIQQNIGEGPANIIPAHIQKEIDERNESANKRKQEKEAIKPLNVLKESDKLGTVCCLDEALADFVQLVSGVL